MEEVRYKINLDVQQGGIQHTLAGFRVGEAQSRTVSIHLVERGGAYQVPAGCSVTMYLKKPDGTASYSTCSVESGAVLHTFTSGEVAVPGEVLCEVRIISAEGEETTVLSSPQFGIIVEDVLQDDEAIESTNEYTALTEAIAEMQVKGAAAVEATQNANAAAGEANAAAGSANAAAGSANAAAESANAAAESANAAADEAETAAGEASNAAQNANTAAEEVRALLPKKPTTYVLKWTDERQTEGYEAVVAYNKGVLQEIEAAPPGSCHIVLQAGQQEYPLCRMIYEGDAYKYCFAGLLDPAYVPFEYIVRYQPAAGSQGAECGLEMAFTANNEKMEIGNLLPPTTTMTAAFLLTKVDKESGKGLSSNDYTTEEKTKLAGIEEGANHYIHSTFTDVAAPLGLYKTVFTGEGHVANKAAVTKEDITPLLDMEAIIAAFPDASEVSY